MTGVPLTEDGTTGLADDFSHVSLDQYHSYNANPGDSYMAAGPSNASTCLSEPSDYYPSASTQQAPPPDPNNPFVCLMSTSTGEVCNLAFPRDCDLTRHQRIHTRPLKCGLGHCKERFAQQKDVDRHYISHHPDTREGREAKEKSKTKKNAVCPVCGYQGNGRPDNVKRHRENKGH